MAQMKANSKTLLTQLVQDAVLKLCTQHITFDTQLEIDGIICVSPGEMVPEIVIKMHRTIMKPEEPVQAQWADITGSDVYTGSPQATHTQSQRSRNRSSQIRGSPQQPSPRHDPPHSKRRLDNQPQLEQYAVPDSMPQTGMNIKSEPTYLDSQTPSGSVGSGDSNTGDGAIVYGVPSGSAKKRKPPELDTTSVANKIIKTEDPILIEEDMTTATDQAYMGGNNSAMAEQGGYTYQDPVRFDVHSMSGEASNKMKYQTSGNVIELEVEYNCDQCTRIFPGKRCLDYHMLISHNKFCDICSSRIDHESDLDMHGLKHKDEKPYQCDVCYKLFNAESGLRTHRAKDLQCVLCGKRLLRNERKRHMSTVHPGI